MLLFRANINLGRQKIRNRVSPIKEIILYSKRVSP
jgi:hypothetical protein